MTDEKSVILNNEARQILFHGGVMTVLSLLSGFTTFFALAPRIALSSHTVGLMQGAMLIAIAGAWHLLDTSPKYLKIIKYTLLVGFYTNWISLQLSALWSAGKSSFPISGESMSDVAAPWQNITVKVLGFLSLLIIVSAILIVLGARNRE
jgi:(hydroxyamino)benzene mutase